jgi:hypothetical protein
LGSWEDRKMGSWKKAVSSELGKIGKWEVKK